MICVLCGREVTLLDLDVEGWGGEPGHDYCCDAARAAVKMIVDEHDPRKHRGHPRSLASVA